MNAETGKWMMLAGVVLFVAGLVIYFFYDKLSFIGKLPGDIRIERESFRFYFPFTTMIILSVLFSVLLKIIKRFM
ncbi:MAG: DUF2905 domain-containing protein [Lacibacter sp.]